MKGLQILATFPGDVSPIPISEFENILITFMSIISVNFSETLKWKLALKALVNIGSFIDRYHESEKVSSYMGLVVEKIVSLVSLDDLTMPFPLKLEAISGIGTSGLNYMLNIVQGLEEAIYANISEVYVRISFDSSILGFDRLKKLGHGVSCVRSWSFCIFVAPFVASIYLNMCLFSLHM